MITLSNIYSREKTLFYFTMWNDSDRLGYKNFLAHDVRNNLFIVPPLGEKGSVWYSAQELDEIDGALTAKLNESDFHDAILHTLTTEWELLKPYLASDKKIQTTEELLSYYKALITWWSAMNTVFGVPDKADAPQAFKETILAHRTESEKYTEKMNKVFIDFWNTYAPEEYKKLVTVLTPEEAVRLLNKEMNEDDVRALHERLQGCFMLNRTMYLAKDMERVLASAGLSLEKIHAELLTEFKGTIAQKGKVRGVVKVVKVKADIGKLTEGDILVTEMTNPDYVPYMKLAGGIITNEGGLTCHAAIVSRELKKPCIIGTKIATQVLKDGDMVEVDADKGVVRILGEKEDKKTDILTEIDWELWIQRKGLSVFVTSLCHEVESSLLKKTIGGGFDYQLSVIKGGDSKWYRSNQDFEKIRNDILHFLQNQTEDELEQFFTVAESMTEKTRAYIKRVHAYSFEETINFFEDIVAEFNTILLYTTSAPYFLLDSLEKIDPSSLPTYELVRDRSERLRGKSLYPEIEVSVLKKLEDALANHFGFHDVSAFALTVHEIREALAQGMRLTKNELVERSECALWWDKKYQSTICFSDRGLIEQLCDTLETKVENFQKVESFKGSVAFVGKVVGTVKVVHEVSDMSKVNQGDILVGHTTNPKLMPAIKLCAGMITDEGGIACHAAIVARELKKPCIIGTKIATQVLKDGDMVEVDAERGVVRILS